MKLRAQTNNQQYQHYSMFKIMPKEQFQALQNLNKINFLSLQSLENCLKDDITIEAYTKAMKNNRHLLQNKVVLHLTNGCNCLYSIIAASLNAAKVYCVINGHSECDYKNIHMMAEVIKENNFQGIIEPMSYKDFNARVDVIIGEPMGYNLIYDGMMDRMIEARDLYLNEEGIIMPNIIKYKCAFIRDEHFTDKKVSFWNEVYGIPMTSMKDWIASEPVVRIVDPTLIVSDVTKFLQFDLQRVSYEAIDDIQSTFKISSLSKKPGEEQIKANGLCIWFQIQFTKGEQKVDVKASPWSEQTRWTHMTLYTNTIWGLKQGESKALKFTGKKNHLQGTATIKLRVQGKQEVYHFA